MGLFGAIGAVASGLLSGGKIKSGLTTAGGNVQAGLQAAGAEVAREVRQASVHLAETALEAAHIHGKYIAATGVEFNKTVTKISDEWLSKVESELKLIREEATQALGFGFGIVAFAIILHPFLMAFLYAEVEGYTSATRTLASYGMVLAGDPAALRSAGLSSLCAGLVLWILYAIADLRYTAQLQMVILQANREEMKQLKAEMAPTKAGSKRFALVAGHGEDGVNKIALKTAMKWHIQNLHKIRSSNFADGVLELSGNFLVVRSGGAGQYILRASVPGFCCQQFAAQVRITGPTGGERIIDGTVEYEGQGAFNSSVRSFVSGLAALQEGDEVGVYAKISSRYPHEGTGYGNGDFVPLLVTLELQEV
eukprot:CAMPEP_0178373054 /NCGR_PEP_ID=MMETSP0689_2-20121128/1668_1 /TAXON_ID=160604 /ORGANISM="Amphidinium massartii, Strain CS-259" /LENGTH=365 /DNA_ID=CAMNT_0019992991 /DNA_START=12 /DNA_END=1109 /DNA_ORIENTATION=+